MRVRDHGGDPSQGSFLLIGQYHIDPTLSDEALSVVVRYQYDIAKLLERTQPSVVFVEDLATNLNSTLIRRQGLPDYLFQEGNYLPGEIRAAQLALEVFPNGIPVAERMSQDQLNSLGLGGAYLYGFSRDGVLLHRALTGREYAQATADYLRIVPREGINEIPGSAFDRLQRRRERFLAREVASYFRTHESHPCRAAIVFGDMHVRDRRFEEAFASQGMNPHIQSVLFPGAMYYRR